MGLRATIRTPSGFYHGENPDQEVPARATDNALRGGFHNSNHTGSMMDALVFSEEPKEHVGEVGIRGALDRIMRYMRYGHMATGPIIIDARNVELR